jgi:4-hydroxybenzoate polyprenyltransferase
VRDTVAAAINLLRLHTAGFGGLVFVLGPLLAGWKGQPLTFALLWLVGAITSGSIFVVNDLVDLPYDRQNPRRAGSPLVAGRISQRAALACSVALPLLAVGVVALAGWPPAPQCWFVLLLVLATFVNVYQKVTRRPLAMDLLFAVTMAAPLPITTMAVVGTVPPLVWSATALHVLLSLELNSVAGNLKDLASDERTGFRTVALELGARLAPDGTLLAGQRYGRYCWMLHGLVTGTALVTLAGAARTRPLPVLLVIAAGAAVVCWWGLRGLRELLGGRRGPSPRGREAYFASGYALLLCATGLRAHGPTFAAAILLLGSWEVAFAAYWHRYWQTASPAPTAVR